MRLSSRASRSPAYRSPQRGAQWCPQSRHHRPGQEPPTSVYHRNKVFKKRQAAACAINKPPRCANALPPPPAPSRWEGERVTLCRQEYRPRGASLASPAPPYGERGVVPRVSMVRFASILTRSVLGLRPALRMRLPVKPLTPFPLQTASRTRIAGLWRGFRGVCGPLCDRATDAPCAPPCAGYGFAPLPTAAPIRKAAFSRSS
jgi:hypothetical protein